MRVQPRLNLLDIWRGVATASYKEGKWQWGGRYQSNSVSDAQQLLCIMFPATEIGSFSLDDPDRTEENALDALSPIGTALEIPVVLVRVLHEYLDKYTDENGTPLFPGGSHFVCLDDTLQPTRAQMEMDVVESFATSLTLMLATVSFVRSFRRGVTRKDLLEELDRLETRAKKRLTAAMVGLLRSFTINTFDASSEDGKILLRSLSQAGLPERRVLQELREELRDVIVGLRDEIRLGSGQDKGTDLSSSNLLFECGWSWGVISGAETIDFADAGTQASGVASDEPYLYFTMVALDSIADLFTERTRRAGLLDENQQRLARELQTRWDLTQQYWSVLADFGPGTWPLEDVPWTATDDIESEYLSVLVAGVAMRNLIERRADDLDLSRLGQVLIELANRGRITRRPTKKDPALAQLHDPGFRLGLVTVGEELGPPLIWPIQDFAAVLLKRTVRVASMLKNTEQHGEMLLLADSLWEHLEQRRLPAGPAKGLWDQPTQAFPVLKPADPEASWQMTVRVVESLVVAAGLVSADPLRSDRLLNITRDMLSEAEHLLDQEFLGGSAEAGPSMRRQIQGLTTKVQRAKQIIGERPASAFAIVNDVLLELDTLAAAREDSTWAR